jgi:hypothetical protein
VATSHRIKEISAEMCHLVNQQSKVLSSEIRFAEMSEEEVAGYLERTQRLKQLSHELKEIG